MPPFTNPSIVAHDRRESAAVVKGTWRKEAKDGKNVGTKRYTVVGLGARGLRLGLYYLHAFAGPFRRKGSSSMDRG